MTKRRMTAQSWIEAGFRALNTGGPGAVRVEPLARGLKVSKGSFYWHFADLGALHRKMIAHWEQQATVEVIAEIAGQGPPKEQLASLLAVAIGDMDAPYGGPETEAAIRGWARAAPWVAEVLERVDIARTGFLEDLLGFAPDPMPAAHWARLFYAAYVGSAHLPSAERHALVRDLLRLVGVDTDVGLSVR